MQKIQKLLLVISLIWIAGCGEDDDTALFVGVWVGSSVTVTECANTTNNNTIRRSCDDERCYRLELNSDKTFSFQEGLPTRSGTWTEGNGTISLCSEEDGEQVCETYDVTLNSATLGLSTTNEANECVTTQVFDRDFDTESEETVDP